MTSTITKPYVAIGYWKWEGKDCHRFVTGFNNSLKQFRSDLRGNDFKASFVMTYKTFTELKSMTETQVIDKAFKMNRNGDYELLWGFAWQLDDEVEKDLNNKLEDEINYGFVPEGTTLQSYL